MPTPISPKLRRRLEAMKELKQEFYVGSKDAFDYLKSIAYYENLLDEVYKDNSVKTRITIREAANLCDKIIIEAKRHLRIVSVLYSDIESLSVSAEHYAESPTMTEFLNLVKEVGGKEAHYWTVDVLLFLKKFLTEGGKVIDLGKEIFLFFVVKDRTPFFIYDKSGERYSLQNIIQNPKLRKSPQRKFWIDCDATYKCIPDTPFYEEYLSLEGIEAFKRAYRDKDLKKCHDTLQKIKAEELNEELGWLEEENEKSEYFAVSEEESVYLLDARKLFLRAEREHSLGLLDVERRIALNFLHSFFADKEKFKSVAEFVDVVIEHTLDAIRKNRLRLEAGESTKAPSVMLESIAESLRFKEYARLAVIQNRNWLIEFLSK